MEMHTNYIPHIPRILEKLTPMVPHIYSVLEDSKNGVLPLGVVYSFQLKQGVLDTSPFIVNITGDGRTIVETMKGSLQEKQLRDHLSQKYADSVKDKNSLHRNKFKNLDKKEFVDARIEDLVKYASGRESLFVCDVSNRTMTSLIEMIGIKTPWYGFEGFMDTNLFVTPKKVETSKDGILVHYHPFQSSSEKDGVIESVRPSFGDLYSIGKMKMPMAIFTESVNGQLNWLDSAVSYESQLESNGNITIQSFASSTHIMLDQNGINPYEAKRTTSKAYIGNFLVPIPSEKEFREFLKTVSKPPFYPWSGWTEVIQRLEQSSKGLNS